MYLVPVILLEVLLLGVLRHQVLRLVLPLELDRLLGLDLGVVAVMLVRLRYPMLDPFAGGIYSNRKMV
jgi:hypothetical protein